MADDRIAIDERHQSGENLIKIIEAVTPGTIDDVVGLMQRIDEALKGKNGLTWFHLLGLSGPARTVALAAQDKMTGAPGSLFLPLD